MEDCAISPPKFNPLRSRGLQLYRKCFLLYELLIQSCSLKYNLPGKVTTNLLHKLEYILHTFESTFNIILSTQNSRQWFPSNFLWKLLLKSLIFLFSPCSPFLI